MGFTAVLMTGGTSTRMGEDKAFLRFAGKPLWRHQLDKLAATEADQRIIAASRLQNFDAPDASVVHDDFPGTGPLGGLVTALKQARNPRILVLAVDLPLMTTWFLRQQVVLRAFLESGVVYERDGRFEPFAALYPKSILVLAQEALRKRRFSMQEFIGAAVEQGAMESFPLARSHESFFANVNTPEEFEAASRQTHGQLDLPIHDDA